MTKRQNNHGKFYSAHSRVNVTAISEAHANTLADFQRADTTRDTVVNINGERLYEVKKRYKEFFDENDLKEFFEKEILKHVENSAEKKRAVIYLMARFHQGALLFPVIGAIKEAVTSVWPNGQVNIDNKQTTQVINIVSTKNGFKVQEVATLKQLSIRVSGDDARDTTINAIIGGDEDYQKMEKDFGKVSAQKPSYILSPNDPHQDGSDPYVIKAHATVDVNLTEFFNPNEENPDARLTVESNAISYGHSHIKNKMDNRSLGQMIVDFFKNLFGMLKVRDISPKADAGIVMNEITNGDYDYDGPEPF